MCRSIFIHLFIFLIKYKIQVHEAFTSIILKVIGDCCANFLSKHVEQIYQNIMVIIVF